MDQICALACDIFSVPVAVVTLLDAEHQWLKARCGLDVESTPRGVAFCNYTIQSDDVLVVPNALEDKRFASNPLITDGLKIRFYAGAPLELEPGIRLGALCLIDYEPRSFSEQDRHRLAQLALLVVSQIRLHAANLEPKKKSEQLEARHAELEWTATHDGLTRLPNRSLFQEKLQAAVETPETGVGGLMIIDLDEFKQINDTLGHEAGDALLVAVGERLSSLVEAPAIVARLGGDEFAILTPRRSRRDEASRACGQRDEGSQPAGPATATASTAPRASVSPSFQIMPARRPRSSEVQTSRCIPRRVKGEIGRSYTIPNSGIASRRASTFSTAHDMLSKTT